MLRLFRGNLPQSWQILARQMAGDITTDIYGRQNNGFPRELYPASNSSRTSTAIATKAL